jgi:hypothetical protein
MEKLGDALGTLINALPPMVGAGLVIAVVFVALVYLWRQAGRDAAKEKARADAGQAQTSDARIAALHDKLDAVLSSQGDIEKLVEEIRTGVAVLRDRARR